MGRLWVHLEDSNYRVEGHLFWTDQTSGKLETSAEAEPFWCSTADLPWREIWGDEILWLPAGLAGSTFHAWIVVRKERIAEHFVQIEE